MWGRIWVLVLLVRLITPSVFAQENLFARYFNLYRQVVPGVDFLAEKREEVKPFEEPLRQARQRLQVFLGEDLPGGAIFVCSSAEQRDSVYEPRALRMGYRWVLMVLSPEIEVRQAMERIRARRGGNLPPEALERFRQRSSSMEQQLVSKAAQDFAYAILMTTLAPEREFRTSRLDDMYRSPLADWLDVGLAAHAAGALGPQAFYLKQHMSESYPIEDILFMSRPVIVPSFVGGETGPPAPGAAPAPTGMGGPGEGRGRPSQPTAVPKDVQDRLMYDAQATTLFAYLLENLGVEKMKKVIGRNRGGEDVQMILEEPDFLGPDMESAEKGWLSWVEGMDVGRGRQSGSREPGPDSRRPGSIEE